MVIAASYLPENLVTPQLDEDISGDYLQHSALEPSAIASCPVCMNRTPGASVTLYGPPTYNATLVLEGYDCCGIRQPASIHVLSQEFTHVCILGVSYPIGYTV